MKLLTLCLYKNSLVLTPFYGGERIQIIESELRWVGDKGGIGVNSEVKKQGEGRVRAI